MGDTLKVGTTGQQRIEYKSQFFLAYDKIDTRRDASFLSAYHKETNKLQGTIFKKIMGHFNQTTNQYVWDADAVLYRLAGVYLMMAEVENMQGEMLLNTLILFVNVPMARLGIRLNMVMRMPISQLMN